MVVFQSQIKNSVETLWQQGSLIDLFLIEVKQLKSLLWKTFIPVSPIVRHVSYDIEILVLQDSNLIIPPDSLHLLVISDELQQEIPPDQQEIFSPELVGTARVLGEGPARLEYLVAQTDDSAEQFGGLLSAVIRILQ